MNQQISWCKISISLNDNMNNFLDTRYKFKNLDFLLLQKLNNYTDRVQAGT